jgi:hypothetical protein
MDDAPEQLCAICGTSIATTTDHIPPKGIFPKPRPNNLITVPACADCNHDSSEIDETFRLYLALHVGDLDDEHSAAYFEDALRTYKHNRRLQREILENAEPVSIHSPGGIYTGEGLRVRWNSDAHDSIIEKTVRGLYFHHFREILDAEVQVSPKWFYRPVADFFEAFRNLPVHAVGQNQFVYRFARAGDKPDASVWLFEFYGRHWAGAHTRRNDAT